MREFKINEFTAKNAITSIGRQKLTSFETVDDLATALMPYMQILNPQISKEKELEKELAELKGTEKDKK
jgi:hypothetical protein